MSGRSALCVGCGSGEECGHLLSLGASRVLGTDRSSELVDMARRDFPGAEFRVLDMRDIGSVGGTFDLAYSSLALHYVEDWLPVLRQVRDLLADGGTFLFSVQHPAYWGAEPVSAGGGASGKLLGYVRQPDGRLTIRGDYLTPRRLKAVRYGSSDAHTFHRPMADMFRDIREAGFAVADFLEPSPVENGKEAGGQDYELYRRIPLFAMFELRK